MYAGKIPFDSKGNQYRNCWEPWRSEDIIWKENEIITRTLKLIQVHRGRSAAYFELIDVNDNTRHYMSMIDIIETFSGVEITNEWEYSKRGHSYGIKKYKLKNTNPQTESQKNNTNDKTT